MELVKMQLSIIPKVCYILFKIHANLGSGRVSEGRGEEDGRGSGRGGGRGEKEKRKGRRKGEDREEMINYLFLFSKALQLTNKLVHYSSLTQTIIQFAKLFLKVVFLFYFLFLFPSPF
jgi:hypothetical protein